MKQKYAVGKIKNHKKQKSSNMPSKAGIDINSNKFFRRCII